MENFETNQYAQSDTPDLLQYLNRLLDLAHQVLENVQYSEQDHFGFMSLCFLSKQVEHTESILQLLENRDVELIARSMLEGLCQLLWAANEPDTRALRWRSFSWIHDWRIMQAKIADNEHVEPARQEEIENAINLYGDQFLTRRARNARQAGNPEPPDPFYRNWTGNTVRHIFESVNGDILYLKLYKPYSDWHHWSPGGIGSSLFREHDRVVYSSPVDFASNLRIAFQCLLQTIELTDERLERGFASDIWDLKREYISRYQLELTSEDDDNGG